MSDEFFLEIFCFAFERFSMENLKNLFIDLTWSIFENLRGMIICMIHMSAILEEVIDWNPPVTNSL